MNTNIDPIPAWLDTEPGHLPERKDNCLRPHIIRGLVKKLKLLIIVIQNIIVIKFVKAATISSRFGVHCNSYCSLYCNMILLLPLNTQLSCSQESAKTHSLVSYRSKC
uniref:Uncharacterized protein n=1 Tax=Esox lucius TaxID=8010 RepID=A0A3P8YSJ1_ESOLU